MTYEELSTLNPLEYNVLFLVLDSCRYDTTQLANIPYLNSLGTFRGAVSHADYTLAAHMAMFEGRLPSVEEQPFLPLYTNSVRQLWRVSPQGFFNTVSPKQIAMSLTGDNIVEAYRDLGFFTLGVASLNYFTPGRTLNKIFNKFLDYYDISEGLIDPRPFSGFPLAHIDEIVANLAGKEKWFLFINTKETHYPYDTGDGYDENLLPLLKKMQRHLNLRHDNEEFTEEESKTLHGLQIKALEAFDSRVQALIEALPKDKPILIVVCSDHGESMGEKFKGIPRCGHLHPSPEVMEVPLMIASIKR